MSDKCSFRPCPETILPEPTPEPAQKPRVVNIGPTLAILGSTISIVGTLFNNLLLAHEIAMLFWMLSNPILFIWAWGYGAGHWDGGLSAKALGVMYLIFTVTNLYGLMLL